MMNTCTALVRNMISKATMQIAEEHMHMTLRGVRCRVYNGGQMTGLLSMLAGHRAAEHSLKSEWASLQHRGVLNGPIDSDLHSVMDVATFFMQVLKLRRLRKKKNSGRLRSLAYDVRLPLLQWIAGALDSYVLRVYSDDNALVHRAPPSLLRGLGGTARQYVMVSPEAAWNLMERAQIARTNVEQAIRLRTDDADLGCSTTVADVWAQKMMQMYMERTSYVFTQLVHWNLASDPGSHSYKDVMPSVLYSCELNIACLPQFQHLLPFKTVTKSDCQLDEEIVPYAEEMKLERVAAYRQLQGPAKLNNNKQM